MQGAIRQLNKHVSFAGRGLALTLFISTCSVFAPASGRASNGSPGVSGASGRRWWSCSEADRNPSLPAGDEGAHVAIIRDSLYLDDGGYVCKELNVKKTYENSVPEEYSRLFRQRSLLIRDRAGVEAIGSISLPHEDNEELIEVRGMVVKPDGSSRSLEESDFHRQTMVLGRNVNVERMIMVPPDLAPGDILQYAYATRSRFDFSPPLIELQDRFPIVRIDVVWKSREPLPPPAAWGLTAEFARYQHAATYSLFRRDLPSISAGWVPGSQPPRFGLIARGMPSIPEEPDQLPPRLTIPFLAGWYQWPRYEEENPFWRSTANRGVEEREKFLRNTQGLDEWMGQVLGRPRDLPGDIDGCLSLIHRQFDNAPGRDADESRRSEENKSVRDLIKHGTGSDWELNMLLIAMLRKLGYHATTFWCGLSWGGEIREDWHSWNQFDCTGVLVKSNDGPRFLFPALRGSTAKSLPFRLSGGRALITSEDAEEDTATAPFATFPGCKAAENVITLSGSVDLSRNPPTTGLKITWNCPAEAVLRDDLEEHGNEAACERVRKMVFPGWDLSKIRAEKVEFSGLGFSYACSLSTERLVEETGRMSLVDLGPLGVEHHEYVDDRRKGPIDLHYPRTVRTDVEVIGPAGWQVSTHNPYESQETVWGNFHLSEAPSPGGVRRRTELVVKQARIRPEGYSDVREFFEAYNSAVSKKIVFELVTQGEGR